MTALASPTTDITNWIYDRLETRPLLSGIGVHIGFAENDQPRPKKNVPAPYITVRHISSVDRRYLGGRLAGTTTVMEITGWDSGNDTTRLSVIAREIFIALDQQRGPSGALYISACHRIAPVEQPHTDEDPPFTQLGGEYQIRASAP